MNLTILTLALVVTVVAVWLVCVDAMEHVVELCHALIYSSKTYLLFCFCLSNTWWNRADALATFWTPKNLFDNHHRNTSLYTTTYFLKVNWTIACVCQSTCDVKLGIFPILMTQHVLRKWRNQPHSQNLLYLLHTQKWYGCHNLDTHLLGGIRCIGVCIISSSFEWLQV